MLDGHGFATEVLFIKKTKTNQDFQKNRFKKFTFNFNNHHSRKSFRSRLESVFEVVIFKVLQKGNITNHHDSAKSKKINVYFVQTLETLVSLWVRVQICPSGN